ncbi:MAG TPA: threonine synthase [Candidatus Nanoarchaeia archaeon]|nr:threonine synthase [Candidatus Nanoarchaeia archaeon]
MPKDKMQGILLIGMPYVGKSTIAKKIAEILGFEVFDGDTEIEKVHPDRQKYLDNNGDEKYIEMEADIVTKLPLYNSVLAPGGSILYSEKARYSLQPCFKVYLSASLETIKNRVTEIDKRGIVRLKKVGLDNLYAERKNIYQFYRDIELDAENNKFDELAMKIVKAYCIKQLSKIKPDINYMSTNQNSKATFADALLLGIAPDKGLFVPDKFPEFSENEINLMKHLNYPELAFVILRQFVAVDDNKFMDMCKEAYQFDLPVKQYGDFSIARLDRGPSASFKDFAMQLLSRMMSYELKQKHKETIILTATSGDTGAAVACAFGNLHNLKSVILAPAQEITMVQRLQMTTAGDNVITVLVDGKFDDCQALAKKAFEEMPWLASANSINIGRLLPQIVYYFYIYSRIKSDTFVVPSGNFGNLVAGLIAKKMGLPIRFIAAVNENDEFPRMLETNNYTPLKPSRKCISNAMNIGNPSNLARLIWLYGGVMDEKGKIIKEPDFYQMKNDIASASVTDEETREAMRNAYSSGIVLEPHGAVGFAAMNKLKSSNLGHATLFETAHPAKFPEELNVLNIPFQIPESILKLEPAKEKYLTIKPDLEELKAIITNLK